MTDRQIQSTKPKRKPPASEAETLGAHNGGRSALCINRYYEETITDHPTISQPSSHTSATDDGTTVNCNVAIG